MRAVRSIVVLAVATACSRGDATAPPVATREAAAPSTTPSAPVPSAHAGEDPAQPPGVADPASSDAPVHTDSDAAPGQAPAPSAGQTHTRPIDEAEGMTTEAVVAAHGEPDDKKGDRWIYRYPRDGGCTDREIVYTLRLRKGTVADVQRTTRQTGQHCAPTDMP